MTTTAAKDPRTPRTRQYRYEGGKVTGIEGIVTAMPATRFELVDFDLFTEEEAKNDIMAIVEVLRWVKQKSRFVPIAARANVMLAWPIDYAGNPRSLRFRQGPGNISIPYRHIIGSGYDAPTETGPLAIYIANDDGSIGSDIAGGLGLPGNRHIGVKLTFLERQGWKP